MVLSGFRVLPLYREVVSYVHNLERPLAAGRQPAGPPADGHSPRCHRHGAPADVLSYPQGPYQGCHSESRAAGPRRGPKIFWHWPPGLHSGAGAEAAAAVQETSGTGLNHVRFMLVLVLIFLTRITRARSQPRARSQDYTRVSSTSGRTSRRPVKSDHLEKSPASKTAVSS